MAEVAEQTKLPHTPPQILGPFYPFMLTPTETGDLTNGGQAKGTVLYLSGRVLTEKGEPASRRSVVQRHPGLTLRSLLCRQSATKPRGPRVRHLQMRLGWASA